MFPIVIPFHQKRAEQDSMVQIPWQEVREIALKTIDAVKRKREGAKRNHILEKMDELNTSWWSRLWKKSWTYQEVEELESLNGGDSLMSVLDNKLHWIESVWWDNNEKAAKRLLNAAAYRKDVWVCSKDLDLMLE